MNLVLTNPWGLLGLLGIPILILIYYLRRRAQVVTVSTLFLLRKTQRESAAGRRLEVFSNSLPFWLQLIAILILTWLLVQPKYGGSRTTQQIVIVVDSSASMQPVRETIKSDLKSQLKKLQGNAAHASYIVLDHDPRRPRLYQGDDLSALLKSFDTWNPTDGALDPTATLRIARSLVGPGGIVAYLTDHDGPALPLSAQRLSLGQGRANVGFTGIDLEAREWTAIIRNYSDSPQSRTWSLETLDQKRTAPKSVTIPPRRFISLKGSIPKDSTRAILRLSEDDFPLDDVMPLIVEKPRVAKLLHLGENQLVDLSQRIVRGFEHVAQASSKDDADLILTTIVGGQKIASDRALIADISAPATPTTGGRIITADHSLIAGLNWQALSVRNFQAFPANPEDVPLLWLNDQPLVLLSRDALSKSPQLLFAFSFNERESNALKLPATAVLLHRFCEIVARDTLTPSAGILETSQLIGPDLPSSILRDSLAATVTSLDGQAASLPVTADLRAPIAPGFLSIVHDEKSLLDAAVHFADTREADLSRATAVGAGEVTVSLIEKQTKDDRFWRWFALGVLLLALGAWFSLGRKTPIPAQA